MPLPTPAIPIKYIKMEQQTTGFSYLLLKMKSLSFFLQNNFEKISIRHHYYNLWDFSISATCTVIWIQFSCWLWIVDFRILDYYDLTIILQVRCPSKLKSVFALLDYMAQCQVYIVHHIIKFGRLKQLKISNLSEMCLVTVYLLNVTVLK